MESESTESHKRSLLKALSYRFFGTLVTFIITFIITQEVIISSSIAVLDLVSKILLFWCHERLWLKIKYGKS